MTENLVLLFNKLSYHIVATTLNHDDNHDQKAKDEKYFRQCMRKIRQKGCDVLLGKSVLTPIKDPCVTDYGGNWSPITLLLDYGKEFESKGAPKFNDMLLNNIKCLQEKEYDCLNDLLKFLLMMKKPLFDSQSDLVSLCGSEFLLSPMDSFTILMEEPLSHLSESSSSRHSTFKKALKYEESWTKSFDSKFQVLGEYSKKNLLIPEKVSFDSLFSARSDVSSQSQSNSFVFTDFCIENNNQSAKNIFDLTGRTCMSDIPLLDSFVDNPITHKLPNLLNTQKSVSKSAYYVKSSDKMKRKLQLLKEEEQGVGTVCVKESTPSTDFSEEERLLTKTSGIELKRNSNCSHSFAILYKKSNCKSEDQSIFSNESLLLPREQRKQKLEKNLSRGSNSSSKEIVLGLWEHDKTILKQFQPELANKLPALRMITTVEFVEDVKYLLTGINTGSFQFNTEDSCFSIQYGTCLNDVTPESLYHFSKEFVETGNLYVKLSRCATESCKTNLETCTTISQAFWKSIFDYLELHYSMVLAIPATTNLMMLKASVKDIYEMIMTISNICKVVKGDSLPEGGQLLTYLLHTVEKINRTSVRNIVFGILQNCCTVYFRCILQPWLFKGQLDKTCNEFFIECNKQKIKIQSRNYYGSFCIAEEKIPSFLKGFEESIYNCGKSVHFLKLFNLEDKFCQILEKLNYPDMRLCLSDAELEKLEKEFREYGINVTKTCGGSISILTMRNEEKEQEKQHLESVRDYKIKQEEERQKRILQELEEQKTKRELQNKLLNAELNRMQEEKRKKKLEEEEAIRKIDEKIRQAADNEKDIINQEKNLLINYYDGLMRTLDTRLNVIETRKNNLNGLLSNSSDNHILDIINDNSDTLNSNKMIDDPVPDTLTTESVDLNSNPILLDVTSSCESVPESVVTVDTITPVRNTNEITVSIDENSNLNSSLESDCLSIVLPNQECVVMRVEKPSDLEEAGKIILQRNVAAAEAIANKMKVMKSEFENVPAEELPRKKFEKTCKTVAETEAMLNRQKILKEEFGSDFGDFSEKSLRKQKSSSKTTAAVEAMANKNKVLAAEYGFECTGTVEESPKKKNDGLVVSEVHGSVAAKEANINETEIMRFDETLKNKQEQMPKSVSQRNVAAAEAFSNKLKVMKSEFAISITEPQKISKSLTTTLNQNIIDRKKVKGESEYNILKGDSDVILIKPVTSQMEIATVGTDCTKCLSQRDQSIDSKDSLNLLEVELERKREFTNIKSSQTKQTLDSDAKVSNSDTRCSITTLPNCDPSDSVSGQLTSEGGEVVITEMETTTSGGVLANPQYQNALLRDTRISNHRLSYDDIFQNLNQIEFDNLPCTELMQFQRFLKKSAQIPLIIQEKLANDALLKHLLVGEKLLSHLKSLRGFFFLSDGEFGRSFTRNTFRSLSKCKESYEFFERSNLSNIVNEALNYTIHSTDQNLQNLSFKIVKMPPFLNHSSHEVLAPFELTYKVEWPLNIILTEKALSTYKNIFKFLLKLKRINWTLNENTLYLNYIFKNRKMNRHVLSGSPHFHKIQIFRHAMIQVMITLDDYIFSNGIQLPWINFLQDLETTENIDHLYQKHVRYIKDVLLRCFLTKNSKELLNCIHNIIELSLKFHYTTVSADFAFVDGKYEHPKFSVLRATFNEFCAVIKTFIRTLKEKIAMNQVVKSHYILIEKFDLKLT